MAKPLLAPRSSGPLRSFHTAVVLAAAAALAVLGPSAGALPWPAWLVALPLLVLGETSTLFPPAGGRVSVGGVLDLACLVLVGPVPTAWLGLIHTFVVQALVQRRPGGQVIHGMAAFALTALAGGTAFLMAGGRVGRLDLPGDIGPVLLGGGVTFVCHTALAATDAGLRAGESPWRIWQRTLPGSLLYPVSLLALGTLVAVVYLETGPWGLLLFAIPLLLARHWFKLYVDLRTDLKDFVRALSEVLEEVDPWTRQHSARVSRYAVRLARELRRPEREVQDIECAALVHDLGKIGPQNQHLLHKPGTLTHEEQRTLRRHPEVGADIVARIRALRRAADIIRFHHERPDGRGYPSGLRSESVPMGARILNVADAFDAMTSDRPYRRALSLEAAVRELERGADGQFDREIVEALLRLHRQGRFGVIPSPGSEALRSLRVWPRRAHG